MLIGKNKIIEQNEPNSELLLQYDEKI